MKKPSSILTLFFLTLFTFTSCSDSLESLAEDKIDYLEEMTEIINKTADGDLSSSEAAQQIREWGKKGQDLQERTKALMKDMSEEALKKESEAIAKEYGERQMQAFNNLMKAFQRLEQSGRATKEIKEAMENVKN